MDKTAAEYIRKSVRDDFPVDACKGWFDSCAYCDKRFCEWIPVDDETSEGIPPKPGFVMFALKNKNATEIVSMLLDPVDIQKSAVANICEIREATSNKRSKATKSILLVRWMVVKRMNDKENSVLCAHYRNSGVLPRFLTEWPGETLMEECQTLVFSEEIKKWCYKQKTPFWRKPKRPVWTNTEPLVSYRCFYLEYFTDWEPLSEVNDYNLAPSDDGLVLLAAKWGRRQHDLRDLLLLKYDQENIVMPIKRAVSELAATQSNYLHSYKGEKPRLEVKWVLMKDIHSDNACELFAHFLNSSEHPRYNTAKYPLPGERSLSKNRNFVFRKEDGKWHHVREPAKLSKSKPKTQKQSKYRMELDDYEFSFQ